MNNSTRTTHPLQQLLLLVTLLWFAISNTRASEPGTLLILGDSISSAYGLSVDDGWVALLQDKLDQQELNLKIVNASITGDTSGNGRGRLPVLLEEYKPQMLIIELGGNDGLRGLSIKKLQSNLTEMADMANRIGTLPVIVAVQLPGNYGKAYNKLFAKAFTSAASATDAVLVPSLFEGMNASADWFQSDGIHPSVKAQPVMLENVWKAIEPSLVDVLAQ